MKHSHIAVFVFAAAGVVGCSRDEQPPAKVAGRSWSCASVSVPGGESLSCTSAALTADGPAPTADGEPCEGSLDNPDECPPDAVSGSSYGDTAVWTDYETSYRCTAGTADCPPAGAKPGTNSGGTTDGTTGGTTGSSGGTTGTSGGTSDGTSDGTSTGGAGRGDDDDRGDKDDHKGSDDKPSGGTQDGTSSSPTPGSSGGGSGSGEEYECRGKGQKRECVKTPSGGGTTDGTSGGTKGDTTGETGGGSGGGSATTGGEPGLGGGSSTGTTTSNGKEATFDGSKNNGDGTSTWCWSVDEVSGQDLSNWVIGTGKCSIVRRSPTNGSETVSPDPNSGLVGVKWNTGGGFSSGQFCVTVQGAPKAGAIKFSMKAPGVAYGMTQGPVCQ